jgi:hypothetical protein
LFYIEIPIRRFNNISRKNLRYNQALDKLKIQRWKQIYSIRMKKNKYRNNKCFKLDKLKQHIQKYQLNTNNFEVKKRRKT